MSKIFLFVEVLFLSIFVCIQFRGYLHILQGNIYYNEFRIINFIINIKRLNASCYKDVELKAQEHFNVNIRI